MIHLMGHTVLDADNPEGDIEIEYSGLRPGEKLYEELLIGDNPLGTDHPQIMKAQESFLVWDELKILLDEMDQACLDHDCERVRELLISAPTGFQPNTPIEDHVCTQFDRKKRHLGNVVAVAERIRPSNLSGSKTNG
jgi:FlaA1/EpsC-like NDP-sugar epimerase